MDNLLLEIGGKELYLDIDKLSEIVRIEPKVPITEDGEEDTEVFEGTVMHVDVTKYEMYREMIGTLLSYNEEYDEKMGIVALNKSTIPFKLSYNTLLMKGIIKEL
jgi:hypothetical protein